MRIFLIQGFWLFDTSIDIVLTLEFDQRITLLKMESLDKVDNIEIESTLRHIVTYKPLQFLCGLKIIKNTMWAVRLKLKPQQFSPLVGGGMQLISPDIECAPID